MPDTEVYGNSRKALHHKQNSTAGPIENRRVGKEDEWIHLQTLCPSKYKISHTEAFILSRYGVQMRIKVSVVE